MPATTVTHSKPSEALIADLLGALDKLFGLHSGFRAVHAKGVMCSGTFTPTVEAARLTRAPHAHSTSTPVIVRFSDFAGVPMVPDNDPNAASPRGIAIRFNLGEHVHTDIVAHSENGFPTRTGEEFLEVARALVASPPTAPKPTPIELFFASHPRAMHFFTSPKPIPTSFARESFFAVTAFKFINENGDGKFGRFRFRPQAGNEYLTNEQAAKKSPNCLMEELLQRVAGGPVSFDILVQMAAPGDNVSDATDVWPEDRPLVKFGTFSVTKMVDHNAPEMRKIIFDPIPRVDGIEASDDPLIEVRSAIYLLGGRRRRAAAQQSITA